MRGSSIALGAVVACFGGTLLVAEAQHGAAGAQIPEPLMGGIHWARGEHPPARPTKSPNLLYHGGPVMHGTTVEPIFWGTGWGNSAFVGDKAAGVHTFYGGIGGSDYGLTNAEYTDSLNHVGTSVTLNGSLIDTSPVTTNGNRTGPILDEVCTMVSNPVENGYYPVYVDAPRGHARFCAWHSVGTCPNGTTVQFAFFFNLDGDSGCDPEDTSNLHSQGLAALANVSGHEFSEMLTDPHLNAWYDSNGEENADKCAWSFGNSLLSFTNGSQWKIQGNWSNAAFTSSSGFPNSSNQNGCIDGNPIP